MDLQGKYFWLIDIDELINKIDKKVLNVSLFAKKLCLGETRAYQRIFWCHLLSEVCMNNGLE